MQKWRDEERPALDSFLAEHAFEFESKKLSQTVSMGVSEMQVKFQAPNDLLEDADRKLYQSKKNGRNRVTV